MTIDLGADIFLLTTYKSQQHADVNISIVWINLNERTLSVEHDER